MNCPMHPRWAKSMSPSRIIFCKTWGLGSCVLGISGLPRTGALAGGAWAGLRSLAPPPALRFLSTIALNCSGPGRPRMISAISLGAISLGAISRMISGFIGSTRSLQRLMATFIRRQSLWSFPPPPAAGQVWSLTQFYSVDFSQTRIGVKKCVFNKRTIKVCVHCS